MLVRSINESSFKRFSYLKWMPFTQISQVTGTKLNSSYLIQHSNRIIYLTNRDFSINLIIY